jgi:tetratricopeptide (TPR) repeat protein
LLLVSRLDAPTPEIARGLVDKALEAEANGLWGRAYIDVRGNVEPGMRQGDEWLRGAANVCKALGFETVVDEYGEVFPTSFPMSHIAFYAGWYREHVAGAFTLPKVEFMPGAFAYHLHSFSAPTLRDASRHWAGPLLAKGATCTMGCVDEPFLGGTPDVSVFAARWIYDGFTFGEAAYAAQPVVSWQTTVVGDPLFRPFGRNPQVQHEDLVRKQSKLLEWSQLRLLNFNQARGVPVPELVNLAEGFPETKSSAVLSEKLGDLCSAAGKPASAIRSYEQALQLNPSPQQRIRLRLALGEKLVAQNRDADALTNYNQLVADAPPYADLYPTYVKLVQLTEKLGKKDEAAKYLEKMKK